MMRITLQRNTLSREKPTYGVLLKGLSPLCVTMERPWLDNKRNVSCIPPGEYKCVPHTGTKFKNVWRLENVPDRSAILIHAANYVHEIEGCIAVGMGYWMEGVSASQRAMQLLKERLPAEFMLEILNP